MKIQTIINQIISITDPQKQISPKSIDQLIVGDPEQDVTTIVTTFMATVEVIKKAIDLKANFIITHEPTWASAHDRTDYLKEDPIYQQKLKLIKDHHIVIWRFHDHMHFGVGHDLILMGFAKQLGWQDFLLPVTAAQDNPLESSEIFFKIPETNFLSVLSLLRDKLSLNTIRYIGNLNQPVKNVAALVGGSSLGTKDEPGLISLIQDKKIDLAICGDITEWTLSSYIRDANALGLPRAMAIVGHERTEEFGMKYLPSWITELTGKKASWIDAEEPFKYYRG